MICSISEMYDLRTVKDKIGVIGIHTPTMDLIARSWKGLLDNHKYVRLIKCDVSIACASHQALDPLQVGTDSDQIAPQDLMNPILYRACTNDSWNVIMNKVYASNGTNRNSIKYFDDPFSSTTATQQENTYYALLASDEWRKAMPQMGLNMTNLRPFVYQVVNTYGNEGNEAFTSTAADNLDAVQGTTVSGNPAAATSGNRPYTFRGQAMPYPAVPCTRAGSTSSNESNYATLSNGVIPKSYVACILMPPSKLQVMYYRLVVRWTFEFIRPMPIYDKYSLEDVSVVGTQVYNKSYSFTSAKTDDIKGDVAEGHTLDTVDAPLELVLQK